MAEASHWAAEEGGTGVAIEITSIHKQNMIQPYWLVEVHKKLVINYCYEGALHMCVTGH